LRTRRYIAADKVIGNVTSPKPFLPSRPPSGTTDTSSESWRERRYSVAKIAAVHQALQALCDKAHTVLDGTGLSVAALSQPETLTSAAQYYTVLQNALLLGGHEARLAWRIGQHMRITTYGMYGYALLSATSLRAAMALAVRYHSLANPLLPLRWEVEGDSVVWLFPARRELNLPQLDDALYRLLVLVQMSIHVTLTRDVMGAWCLPQSLQVSWRPPSSAPHGEVEGLSCPVSYAAPRCALNYPAQWLEQAPQYANAFAAAQTSRECARLQESLTDSTAVVRQVYRLLTQTPGQFPGLEAVAQALHMSSRTLRRHLGAQGYVFGQLHNQVRQALAEDYLQSTRLGLDDIAQALDFADVRSFRGAFKRWTGLAPSDWRTGHAKANAS
jgi:AraC-like DNA-binding protein